MAAHQADEYRAANFEVRVVEQDGRHLVYSRRTAQQDMPASH